VASGDINIWRTSKSRDHKPVEKFRNVDQVPYYDYKPSVLSSRPKRQMKET